MAVKVRVDQKELLEKLKTFSSEMEKGSIEALYGVRELIDEHTYHLIEVSRQTEPRVFAAIWVLREFIGELWCNLGGDATGFPKERGTPYIIEISKGLGQFIQESLFREGKPMEAFTKTIDAYFGLLRLVDEELLQRGKSSTEDWCVL